jgi:hypothetical protein
MNLGYLLFFCATLTNGFLYNYPCLRGNTRLSAIITDDNDGYWEERVKKVRKAANITSRRKQRRKTMYIERRSKRQLNKYNYIYDDFSFEPVIIKSNYSIPF